jgi:hypothetical protein
MKPVECIASITGTDDNEPFVSIRAAETPSDQARINSLLISWDLATRLEALLAKAPFNDEAHALLEELRSREP